MNIKCLIVGDGAVGKTAYITRHATGEFIPYYNPTTTIKVPSLKFNTSKGYITFDLYDGPLALVPKIDCVIIMFDLTKHETYDHVRDWYQNICDKYGNIPIILCGNKVDMKHLQVKLAEITVHRELGLPYYSISAKSNYNFEKPFLHLARHFLDDPDLYFTENEPIVPPTVTIDPQQLLTMKV